MKTLSYSFTVLEMNESKSLLTGLVDVGRADPEETCHAFHEAGAWSICGIAGSYIVETYITPVTFRIAGFTIRAGQWLMKLWLTDFDAVRHLAPGSTIKATGCPLNKNKTSRPASVYKNEVVKNMSAWEQIEKIADGIIRKNASLDRPAALMTHSDMIKAENDIGSWIKTSKAEADALVKLRDEVAEAVEEILGSKI